MMKKALPLDWVRLTDHELTLKRNHNRNYLMELKTEHLLRNHYLEACLWQYPDKLEDGHWGWESPTSQLRGHFLGHWLSAAAMMYASTKDAELKGKADYIVTELRRCQQSNGGKWVGAVPPSYLDRLVKGKTIWVPQYNLHKTFMGLLDMHRYAGSQEALDIAVRWAEWFSEWIGSMDRETIDNVLDVETGGMMEVWADLYGITGVEAHLKLIEAYSRPRLFDPLCGGVDVLTNKHGNTTIPEALGAARAYEVTGDPKWRRIVEAYWKSAVTDRGAFCTGGQTSGEVWTPPMQQAARLGDRNQEHCSVYNMMRLADFLFRWTGHSEYGDYLERNLYNGIMAQGYVTDYTQKSGEAILIEPEPELITYYLPLKSGAQKYWGSKRNHFWCCHGSVVQANADHTHHIYYEDESGLTVSQYLDSELDWVWNGRPVRFTIRKNTQAGDIQKLPREPGERLTLPNLERFEFSINCETPESFALTFRKPWWVKGEARIALNGIPVKELRESAGFYTIERTWDKDHVVIEFPMALQISPLPDEPDKVAFMYGPEVLAGLTEEEITLYGDPDAPETLLAVDDEREWWRWNQRFRTVNQYKNIRFIPLNRICHERYTVYFPIRKPAFHE